MSAAPRLAPIGAGEIDAVAGFLNRTLNARVAASTWAAGLRVGWPSQAENHGFCLVSGDEIVGAALAFYAERTIRGRPERFCNLGAFCVQEEHRVQSVLLLRALLRQRGYHFTDFSPSGSVPELNRRFGFVDLDTTTQLVPNLPWAARRRPTVLTEPDAIAGELDPRWATILADHRSSPAALHLLLVDGSRQCYVISRRDRRKRLGIFRSVLFVSDHEVFAEHQRTILNTFLRQGSPLTLVERRVAPTSLAGAYGMRSGRPRMFKSSSLEAQDVDYLYSELTQIPW